MRWWLWTGRAAQRHPCHPAKSSRPPPTWVTCLSAQRVARSRITGRAISTSAEAAVLLLDRESDQEGFSGDMNDWLSPLLRKPRATGSRRGSASWDEI